VLRLTDPDIRLFASLGAHVSVLSLSPVLLFLLLKSGNRCNAFSTQTSVDERKLLVFSATLYDACYFLRIFSPTLNMKAIRSSETSENLYGTARGHITVHIFLHVLCNVTNPFRGSNMRSNVK
jgi:hypothetical protein